MFENIGSVILLNIICFIVVLYNFALLNEKHDRYKWNTAVYECCQCYVILQFLAGIAASVIDSILNIFIQTDDPLMIVSGLNMLLAFGFSLVISSAKDAYRSAPPKNNSAVQKQKL